MFIPKLSLRCIGRYQVLEQFVHVLFDGFIHHFFDHGIESLSIGVIDQSIVEDSIDFVDPQTIEFLLVFHVARWNEKDSSDDTGEISQIEEIMRFLRGGKKLVAGFLVDLHGGLDEQTTSTLKRRFETTSEMPIHNRGEDLLHRFIAEWIDGDDVAVTGKTTRDRISTTAGWTHRTEEELKTTDFHLLRASSSYQIEKGDHRRIFTVEPIALIEPLS